MNLFQLGFDRAEVSRYFDLSKQGIETSTERLRMLDKKRSKLLKAIHKKEALLEQVDYLRYEIREQKHKE